MLIENQLKKLGFGTAALFLLIVAMLLGAPQMYLMAVVLALVPIVGWGLNRLMTRGLVCERSAPETATEGTRALITILVTNKSLMPKFYLRVFDALPRFVLYAGSPPDGTVFLTRLWPGESTKIKYFIEPQMRGLHKIGPLTVEASDVFGFSDFHWTIPSYSEVLVYPQILPVSPSLLSSGAASGWRDEQDADNRGSGTDFMGVREYRVGDELRRVNWKTTARTGMLAVTEYSQGYANDIAVFLDCEAAAYEKSGIGKVSAFEYGVLIATALGATAMRRGSRMQLSCGREQADRIIEMEGVDELPLLLDRLARLVPDGDVTIEYQLAHGAAEVAPGTVVVVITPRPMEDESLRTALSAWQYPPLSARIHTFWLSSPSFDAAANQHALLSVPTDAGQATASVGHRSDLGCEYFVSATTDLISLLGGQAVG